MTQSIPTLGRRLPVVPPALPAALAAVMCGPLLVAGLAELLTSTRADGLRITAAVAAFAGYLGLVLTVGTLVFTVFLWPAALERRSVRTTVAAGWVAGAAGALMSVLTTIAYATGTRVTALNADTVDRALPDPDVRARLAALALWTLAIPVLAAANRYGAAVLRNPAWLAVGFVVALGLLRLTSVTASQSLTAATTVASLAHLLGMTIWLGGLVVLCLGLRRMSPADLAQVLPRFSRVAFAAVAGVTGTGVGLTLAYLDAPSDLVATEYGRLIGLKIALMGLVLAAARRSQRWVSRRLAPPRTRHDGGTVRTLMCAVAAETTLAIAMLSAAAALVTAP